MYAMHEWEADGNCQREHTRVDVVDGAAGTAGARDWELIDEPEEALVSVYSGSVGSARGGIIAKVESAAGVSNLPGVVASLNGGPAG